MILGSTNKVMKQNVYIRHAIDCHLSVTIETNHYTNTTALYLLTEARRL